MANFILNGKVYGGGSEGGGGGGGGSNVYGGTSAPTSSIGESGDYYYQYEEPSGDIKITYVKLEDTWHKLDGGDIIIIGGGDKLEADYGAFNVAGINDMAKEGTIND
jgi:hypothetical protein